MLPIILYYTIKLNYIQHVEIKINAISENIDFNSIESIVNYVFNYAMIKQPNLKVKYLELLALKIIRKYPEDVISVSTSLVNDFGDGNCEIVSLPLLINNKLHENS